MFSFAMEKRPPASSSESSDDDSEDDSSTFLDGGRRGEVSMRRPAASRGRPNASVAGAATGARCTFVAPRGLIRSALKSALS